MTTPEEATKAAEAQKEAEKKADQRAFYPAFTELLFVLLPFIVIAFTLGYRGEIRTILFLPEWSIVSAVIVGQSIVKLASAGIGRRNVDKEFVVLLIAIVLVVLLVPILITLAIVLTARTISLQMAVIQGAFFIISGATFLISSWIENAVLPRRRLES
jgi:hypothetical protein